MIGWSVFAGVPHLREGDVPPQGGRPGWAGLPNPRMGPWIRLLKNIAQAHNLVPEFEVPFLFACLFSWKVGLLFFTYLSMLILV